MNINWTKIINGTMLVVFIVLVTGIVLLSIRSTQKQEESWTPKGVSPTVTKILSVDSCGCKVFRVESDGHVFLVNNQGGIVRAD